MSRLVRHGGPDLHPDSRLIVGIALRPDGTLVVRLESVRSGLHTHVADPGAIRGLRDAWSDSTRHLTTRVPLSALCNCDEGRAS